jgi:hypothetical protein
VEAPVKDAIGAHSNLVDYVQRMNARFYPAREQPTPATT